MSQPGYRIGLSRGARWRSTGGALCVLATLAVLASIAPGSGVAAACENESIREAQGSTFLPECRAWELVSPSGQTPVYTRGIPNSDAEPLPSVAGASASESGERITYSSPYPTANAQTYGEFFLAIRNPETGWSVTDAAPPLSTDGGQTLECRPFVYFSQTLAANVLEAGFAAAVTPGGAILRYQPCSRDEPPLVPGEPEGVSNILLRNQETGLARLVDLVPPGVTPENAVFEGSSADMSHVLFGEEAKLVAGAPAGLDLYEWSQGALRLVSYTQEGEPVEGALADTQPVEVVQGHAVSVTNPGPAGAVTHSVSSDGEMVFFTANGGLYLRENASQAPTPSGRCEASDPNGACTVELDATQGGSGTSGGGRFLYAASNGERAFFLDERRLTPGATAVAGKPDLYEYDAEEPEGRRLKDLTANSSEAADVLGYSGASEDGAYLYFVAEGALTGANREGAAPVKKQPNLYVAHEGGLAFVATLESETDANDWAAEWRRVRFLSTASSPDGRYFAFDSTRSLSGYDSEPVPVEACGARRRCPEVFLYSATEAGLACASCDSGGRRPSGPSGLVGEGGFNGAGGMPEYPQHRLFDDGQLFFESASGLTSEKSDGVAEVYEYRSGTVSLISSGDAEESTLAAVSANAENVFFVSTKPLVGADTGGTPSLYDARVEGGFAEPAAHSECEAGEACLGPLSAGPAQVALGTPSFQGPGNLAPPPPKSIRTLTREQKLLLALKRCRSRAGRRRRGCEAAVRKRFGVKPTRRQKLEQALARCRKRSRKLRARCEANARRRFGQKPRRGWKKTRGSSGKHANHGQVGR
ncbi:MAG: TolB-like translocation protein [Solirubrobacteraceae bacterium]